MESCADCAMGGHALEPLVSWGRGAFVGVLFLTCYRTKREAWKRDDDESSRTYPRRLRFAGFSHRAVLLPV